MNKQPQNDRELLPPDLVFNQLKKVSPIAANAIKHNGVTVDKDIPIKRASLKKILNIDIV